MIPGVPSLSAKPDAVDKSVDWFRIAPFLGLHALCLAPIWVGWSWLAVGIAVLLYFVRMFFITGFYHRYFSHRTFKTSRPVQFMLGVLGSTAAQRGPLWWAAHHRHHHSHADEACDVHSPRHHGFWWSHMFWFTNRGNYNTDLAAVPDLAKVPELRLVERCETLIPLLMSIGLFLLGAALERWVPALQTNGWQLFVWGFIISTVVLFHGTYTINSLAHKFGRRRFNTTDDSRNSLLLSLITLGEGWHNNHHYYCASVRQGFYWWEIDVTYYVLRALAWLGIIWDLRPVPEHVYATARQKAAVASE